MALDPRIILGFNPGQIGDLGKAAQDARQMQAVELGGQEIAGQNALKQIFADPQSIDPATGSPTPNALRRIMQADPKTGMQFQQNMLNAQQHQLNADVTRTKLWQTKYDMTVDANAGALEVYDKGIANGLPEPAAREQAQQALTASFQRIKSSGLFSDTDANGFQTTFDPPTSRGYVNSSLEWRTRLAAERKTQQDNANNFDKPVEIEYTGPDGKPKRVLAQQNATTSQWVTADEGRHPIPTTGLRIVKGDETPTAKAESDANTIANQAIADREQELGRPLTEAEKAQARQQARIDPKIALQVQKDATHRIPDEVSHNVAEQYVETGNPQVLAGFRRSPAMMSQLETDILKVQKERGMSAKDVARQSAQFAAYGQGVKAFEAGGKLEPIVRSLSVATGHLGLLDQAATALNNGNLPLFNQFANSWAKEAGRTAPTNFDGLKRIVAEELVKAVTGSAGALGDREALQQDMDKRGSPKQLHELITDYKQLMAGQLDGLRQSYQRLETGKDFDKEYLSPAAQREVARYSQTGSGGGGGAQAAPAVPTITKDAAGREAFTKLAPGLTFIGPDGVTYTKK